MAAKHYGNVSIAQKVCSCSILGFKVGGYGAPINITARSQMLYDCNKIDPELVLNLKYICFYSPKQSFNIVPKFWSFRRTPPPKIDMNLVQSRHGLVLGDEAKMNAVSGIKAIG